MLGEKWKLPKVQVPKSVNEMQNFSEGIHSNLKKMYSRTETVGGTTYLTFDIIYQISSELTTQHPRRRGRERKVEASRGLMTAFTDAQLET